MRRDIGVMVAQSESFCLAGQGLGGGALAAVPGCRLTGAGGWLVVRLRVFGRPWFRRAIQATAWFWRSGDHDTHHAVVLALVADVAEAGLLEQAPRDAVEERRRYLLAAGVLRAGFHDPAAGLRD